LCCDYGDGGYSIVYNNGTPITSKFEKEKEEVQAFGDEYNCPQTPDDDSRAVYWSMYGVPGCPAVSSDGVCSTVGTGLLNAKTVSGEPNGPNALGADVCKDGRGGEYMVDESSEAITVSSVDGTMFKAGSMVKVTSHAFIFGNPLVEDVVDFWHTEDVYSDDPKWEFKGTVKPLEPGLTDIESPMFALGDDAVQAVRVVVRWAAGGMPDPENSCPSWGEFNDVDDLVFEVGDGLGIHVAGGLPAASVPMAPPLAFPVGAECPGYKKGRCDAAAGCEWKGGQCV